MEDVQTLHHCWDTIAYIVRLVISFYFFCNSEIIMATSHYSYYSIVSPICPRNNFPGRIGLMFCQFLFDSNYLTFCFDGVFGNHNVPMVSTVNF